MADLQQQLETLITSYEEKSKSYDSYLDTSKQHNDIILKLAESQPIDIKNFEEAEELYDNMVLSEKSYRIQREVYDSNRHEVINKLTPVQNIKIRFSYTNQKTKQTAEYYVWLKYSSENPDESQLVLQKISDGGNEPMLL